MKILVVFTASWAISVYYAYQRTWKPFNPILGETYEMVNHGGITFIAEQVNCLQLLTFLPFLISLFFLAAEISHVHMHAIDLQKLLYCVSIYVRWVGDGTWEFFL